MITIQCPHPPQFTAKTEIFLPTEERHFEEQYHPDQRQYYQAILVYGKIEVKPVLETTEVRFVTMQ